MSNEKRPAVSSTTLTVAMAYKHGGFFGFVPNVPAQEATFKDEIISHDVLRVLIGQHHNNPVSGRQQWVEAVYSRRSEMGGKARSRSRSLAYLSAV